MMAFIDDHLTVVSYTVVYDFLANHALDQGYGGKLMHYVYNIQSESRKDLFYMGHLQIPQSAIRTVYE